ncbi:MAG: hypothetical protein GY799_02285 [Desulfobulbaceae bacterium]|nr:hypothetical protein [Desulfobulbaceae bacterium]
MGKSSTTLEKGDNLPARGKSNKTRILNAIRSESVKELIGLIGEPTKDQAEEAFFKHIAKRAFSLDDKDSGQMLKVLADKGWSSVKPTMERVEFTFDAEATPSEQASQVLKAASNGAISPDVANMFIDSISKMLKIEEVTEIRKELDELKEMIANLNG